MCPSLRGPLRSRSGMEIRDVVPKPLLEGHMTPFATTILG